MPASQVGCCGSNSFDDYFANSTYQIKPSPNAPKCKAVPLTCCERNNQVANNTDWSNLKPIDLKDYKSCCDINNKEATGRYHTVSHPIYIYIYIYIYTLVYEYNSSRVQRIVRVRGIYCSNYIQTSKILCINLRTCLMIIE